MKIKKLKKYSKIFFIQFCITLGLLISLEFFIKYYKNYGEIIFGDKDCKQYNNINEFSFYKPNCSISYKHWESKLIDYSFNNNGRRDTKKRQKGNIFIASIGDSFTLGANVPIDNNYNFFAFNKLIKDKYIIHNYGVAGEQLNNIFNKLNGMNFDKYKYIIYGLTPNDFFDYLDKEKYKETEKKGINIYEKIENLISSFSVSKFILQNILSNDEIYFQIYMSKTPYSGYLLEELSEEWEAAIENLESKIINLDENIKSKIKIVLLPQRADVVAKKIGKENNAFKTKIKYICRKTNIDCLIIENNDLAKIKKSHFIVDGHLTEEGNEKVAKQLAEWSKEW